MSLFRRETPWANSALVVSVGPGDFPRKIPPWRGWNSKKSGKKTPSSSGGEFQGPGTKTPGLSAGSRVKIPGNQFQTRGLPASLNRCLPPFVVQELAGGSPGLQPQNAGLLLPRCGSDRGGNANLFPGSHHAGEDFQSVTVKGLYPCGEGSGYAGGIISSALDGIKAAEAIVKSRA